MHTPQQKLNLSLTNIKAIISNNNKTVTRVSQRPSAEKNWSLSDKRCKDRQQKNVRAHIAEVDGGLARKSLPAAQPRSEWPSAAKLDLMGEMRKGHDVPELILPPPPIPPSR